MSKQKKMLSIEDRRAIDVVLDHAAGAPHLTRLSTDVSSKRIAAVTQLLHLLNHLPEIDPPTDLVARTMARIDNHVAGSELPATAVPLPASAHLH